MLVQTLQTVLSNSQITAIGMLLAIVITFFALNAKFDFLPRDQGRAFAINGQLSKGKLRGVGLIMTICYIIVSLLFLPVSMEYIIFCVLLFAIMLSGYLDDAAETPWSDYKKGAIDLVISIVYVVTFIMNNSTDVTIFHYTFHIPALIYGLLGIVLIWVSINVVNCSDGVDGLCASLSVATIASFALLFGDNLMEYFGGSMILIGVLIAYLYFNTSPSSMLMGDAGSRSLGFFIAVLSMKSGHPFAFIILALAMVIDGGLGLVKIFLLRFLKIAILKNTRTPIHDEMRKNRSWSDTQVVIRFTLAQIVVSAILIALIG